MRALLMTANKGGWQPGANTLCYLPIDANDTIDTVYDHSGNGNNFVWRAASTGAYDTLSSNKRVLSLSDNYLRRSSVIASTEYITINMWCYGCDYLFSNRFIQSGKYYGIELFYNSLNIGVGNSIAQVNFTGTTGSWYNIGYTIDDGTGGNTGQKVYKNGIEVGSTSTLPTKWGGASDYLGRSEQYGYNSTGKIGAVIIESGNRTAQEVLDYYNSTKSDYGL